MKIKFWQYFIVLFIFLAGCENEKVNGDAAPVQRTETLIDILNISNGRSVSEIEQGQAVRLVLELKNISDETLVLNFSSGQQYDFEVRDAKDQIVWQWSNGGSFIQSTTMISLESQGQVKFTPDWKLTDNQGNPLPIGTYIVSGMITTTGPEFPQTQEKTLTITQKSGVSPE